MDDFKLVKKDNTSVFYTNNEIGFCIETMQKDTRLFIHLMFTSETSKEDIIKTYDLIKEKEKDVKK